MRVVAFVLLLMNAGRVWAQSPQEMLQAVNDFRKQSGKKALCYHKYLGLCAKHPTDRI